MRKGVAKSGESGGSKSITGYENRDLFKRGLPQFFAIALFTIFIPLFLAPTATANGTDPCGFLTPTAIGVFGVRSG